MDGNRERQREGVLTAQDVKCPNRNAVDKIEAPKP